MPNNTAMIILRWLAAFCLSSGGMLLEAVEHLKTNGQDPRSLSLYGQEKELDTWAIAQACITTSAHTPSKRHLRPSPRSLHSGRRQSSGLIVRGSTYYLRLRVPRPLAGIIGKTHVMKSLGTGYRAEAVSPTSVERQVYRSNRTVAATLGPRSQICFVRQDR